MEIEQITNNIQALYKEQKTGIVIAWLLNSCVAFLSGFLDLAVLNYILIANLKLKISNQNMVFNCFRLPEKFY